MFHLDLAAGVSSRCRSLCFSDFAGGLERPHEPHPIQKLGWSTDRD